LNDSDIFNDRKHRAVSLRQLSLCILSFENASDTDLVNRPKMAVFVKFYSNQWYRGNFTVRTTRPLYQ